MSIEIIGLVYHQITSPAADAPAVDFDLDALHAFAQNHEASGFDRVLVSQSATMPDPLMIGTYLASVTGKLKFMIAHRPGFLAPTLAARTFATIDRLSDGRASVHIISGASDAEMLRDGDALSKEQRYRRSREYALIMRSLWSANAPIDHCGEFYRFEQAYCDVKPRQPLPLSWAGASPLAFETAGECADVYAMVGDAPATASEFVGKVRGAAERHGRSIGFAITLCIILGDTEDHAWRNAAQILARIEAQVATRRAANPAPAAPHASVAFQRLQERSNQSDLVGKNLWLAINRVTGVAGNNTTIVGTVEQVVETLMIYHAIGFTSFLLRGFNPLEDAILFGRELIPHFRAVAAQRAASAPDDAGGTTGAHVDAR